MLCSAIALANKFHVPLKSASVQAQVYDDLDYNIFLKTLSSAFKKHVELWKLAALRLYKSFLCIPQISMTYGYFEFCSLKSGSDNSQNMSTALWSLSHSLKTLACFVWQENSEMHRKEYRISKYRSKGARIKTEGSTGWVSLAELEMLRPATERASSLSMFALLYSLWCMSVLWFCLPWVYLGGGIKLMSAGEGQCYIFILF